MYLITDHFYMFFGDTSIQILCQFFELGPLGFSLQDTICEYSLSFCGLSFHLINSILCTVVLNFHEL